MSTIHSNKIAAGYEPISGYTLEQKIGEGGFGEVWRANAPGGLKKAVKFVFGATDAKRGSRELKSLERIKGVHHPFLLTLERFGIVEDRLVIVTELADGSLEDVLKRHLDRGSCGIPRASLLSYLHDAADALDYLHSNYQLQHLDVKPGNMLMVGGHVKVGDFGLLKDLRDNDQSIVGGLTPIYAPPELFDGRPAINSDQYSLAVMYQELLTGTRPFAGRTIAQLATQHIHAAPNLDPLPPVDRVAVARALEKNPTRRYESCKDFVDALRVPRERDQTRVQRIATTDAQVQAVAVEDLPQLAAEVKFLHHRVTGHALVVAVGGVGAEVLHELRARVANLHSACPLDLHSVLVDTDMDTTHAARLAEASDRIPPATIIHTPLKSAQEYRAAGTQHLRSMSRRWIYNVPRSGSTEGLRPLGRLAMIDHAEKIDSLLRETIDHLAAVCGDRVPSVYLVGSLSGGTASGMVMDMAARLRHLLDEAGLESASVLPLLTTVSLQGNPHQTVTLVGTHAAVSEIRHYLTPGNSYPGDLGISWAPVPAARNPLQDAYLVVDGDPATPNASSATATVVDYLWADATGASELLAAARSNEVTELDQLGKPMLRTVGVARLRCLRVLEENLLAPAAARHLLLQWLGRPAESRQIAGPLSERLRKRCGFNSDGFIQDVLELFGKNQDEIGEALGKILMPLSQANCQSGDTIDAALRAVIEASSVETKMVRRAATATVTLRREIATRLLDRTIDVTSAGQGIEALRAHVLQSAEDLRQCSQNADRDEPIAADASVGLVHRLEAIERFAQKRVLALAQELAAIQIEFFANELVQLQQTIERTAVGIAQAIRCVPGDSGDTENPWDEMPQEIRLRFQPLLDRLHTDVAQRWLVGPMRDAQMRWDVDELAAHLVAQCLPVVEEIIDRHRRESESHHPDTETDGAKTQSAATSAQKPDSTNVTRTADISGARPASSTAGRNPGTVTTKAPGPMETQAFTDASEGSSRFNEQTTIESALEVATPPLLKCGGRQRLLLLVGTDADKDRLEPSVVAAHSGAVTTVVIPGITPILIHEAQQIPVDNVLKRLELVSGADTQVSRRLHARGDVTWNCAAHPTGPS